MSMNNQKTLMVIAGLAIVIGGVAFLGNDFPAGSDKASGTIVPAERYRGEQITSDDITLGDEAIAKFMQTDAFEYLTNNPELVEDLSNADFANVMANADFANLMANADFANAMANRDFANAMANRDFARVMANGDFANAMANRDFANAMANGDFARSMANGDFARSAER